MIFALISRSTIVKERDKGERAARLLTRAFPPLIQIVALVSLALFSQTLVVARTVDKPLRVALIEVDESRLTKIASGVLRPELARGGQLVITDNDLTKAATRGVGYAGSMNLRVDEARDLGASIGCDFYLLLKFENVRRSSSQQAIYFEAQGRVMIVNARTGELIAWDFLSDENPDANKAEVALLSLISEAASGYQMQIINSATADAKARESKIKDTVRRQTVAPIVIIGDEAASDNEDKERSGVRPPQAFRRLRPTYTLTASRAEVEATVDTEVEISAAGEVARIVIVRWAGFGLDASVTETIKQMHFRPARRHGANVASQVLLRYNFRSFKFK